MRSSKSRSRSKQNRPRSIGNIINRVFDSSGPEGKVRGTPQQIIEKYQALARDAQLSNDRVAAENFLQHAEHYTRLLAEAQRELAAEQEARAAQYAAQNGGRDGQNREGRDWSRDRDNRDRREGDVGQSEQPYVAGEHPFASEGGDDHLVETPEARGERRDDRREPRHDRRDDRGERQHREDRQPRGERHDRGERSDRGERTERTERTDRTERSDRGERRDPRREDTRAPREPREPRPDAAVSAPVASAAAVEPAPVSQPDAAPAPTPVVERTVEIVESGAEKPARAPRQAKPVAEGEKAEKPAPKPRAPRKPKVEAADKPTPDAAE